MCQRHPSCITEIEEAIDCWLENDALGAKALAPRLDRLLNANVWLLSFP